MQPVAEDDPSSTGSPVPTEPVPPPTGFEDDQSDALRRFRVVLDTSSDGIVIIDRPSMRFVDSNATMARMLGLSREELLAIGPADASPRSRAQLEAIFDGLIAGEHALRVEEVEIRRKDGTAFFAEVRRNAHHFGDTWFIVCVVRDISARIQAEAALRDSEREHRNLVHELDAERSRLVAAQRVAKVGSWETDVATGAVNWSGETHRIHGTDAATFHPTHGAFLELVHPADRDSVDEAFTRSLEMPATHEIKHRLLLADGTTKVVEERWVVELDDTGQATRVTGTCQDISVSEQVASHLQEFKERLSLATRAARIGIWDWSVRDNTLVWDRQMRELFGLAALGPGGALEAWTQGLHREDRERTIAQFDQALAGTCDVDTEYRVVWPDGEFRDLKAYGTVKRDDNGAPVRVIGVTWDITERKADEARIRRLNRVHEIRSQVNALIVRVGDRDELFREACRIAVEQGGLRMAMVVMADSDSGLIRPMASAGKGEALLAAVTQKLADPARCGKTMIAQAIAQQHAVVSNDLRLDDRPMLREEYITAGVASLAVLPLLVSGRAVGALVLYAQVADFFHAGEMELLAELAGDIAFALDHIDKEARLKYLAYYDVVTGLANRTLFLERLARAMHTVPDDGRKLAVLLVDLERFRNINDNLGRGAGDELLRQVAAWLAGVCGDRSRLARVEADRYALLLEGCADVGAVTSALEHAIDDMKRHPFRLNDAEFRMAARFGVALFPDDGGEAETVLMHAEAALKKAKASGERYVFYTQAMTETAARQLSLETQLREALEQGEFVLHYQPKVDLQTGAVTSAEALLRWNNPRTGGLVPPGMFIPVLEETGLIYEVGRWALKQALTDYLRWRNAGLPAVRIAVNVSLLQLRHPGFLGEVLRVLAVDDAAAQGLELEITESMVMSDVEQGSASLQALRDLGLTLAIDDFGTGYSSLGYLSRLPVNTLKIDRSFIAGMDEAPAALSLVSTMINLAHSLNLKVVAEGVETQEQAKLLRLLKCDEMQGYLFSRPVPRDVFETRFLMKNPPC